MTSPAGFCGKCGKSLAESDDRFCRSCGAPLVTDASEASDTEIRGTTGVTDDPTSATVADPELGRALSDEPRPSDVPLCAKCGTERVGTRPYCINCATKWPDGTPSGQPAPRTAGHGCMKWVMVAGGIAIALLIFLAIIGSVIGGNDNKDDAGRTAGTAATQLPTTIPATLTAEQVAYSQAVATSESQGRLDRQATLAAQPTRTPVPPPTPIPPPYKLALVSASCNRQSFGYIKCSGFVRNLTDTPLRNVEAVVTSYDASVTPVSSDDALISYNPVLAGQESPWEVITTDNPAYAKWSVNFKDLLGGTILTRDDTDNHALR